MLIENITRNTIIATDAQLANTFFTRLKGLLGTEHLTFGSGLVIQPCYSIHTVGMKYRIDALFMDQQDRVMKCVMNMPAGKFSICSNSRYVIELPAGTIAATGTSLGDILTLVKKATTP